MVSSDLSRCRATADAIAGGRPRLPDMAGLREIHFGDWELKSFAEIDASDGTLSRRFWEKPGHVQAPNGESWFQTESRVSQAVQTLRGPADVIIVAHFGVILTQLALALQKDPAEILSQRVDNLSVTRICLGPDGASVGEINHIP